MICFDLSACNAQAERKQFKKTIEDIFFTLEDKIPTLYPMKIYRCLKRYGLDTLPSDFVNIERKIKKFRRYGIGYVHIDLLYAPKINKERSYIYTAIDRVCKVAFVMLGKRKTKETGARFLSEVIKFYPYLSACYLSACYLSACNAQADAQAGKTPAQYLKETKGITLQRIVS